MPERAPSALPRPIVPGVPSNRFAVLGAVGATLAARLTGRGWPQALGVGGAAFTAWALSRELNPDDPGSANLALLLSAGAALTRPPTLGDLLAAFGTVSALRVQVATVGPPPSDQDALALSVQAGLAGLLGNAGSALGTPLALLASARTQDRWAAPAWSPWAALGAVGLAWLLRGADPPRASVGGSALAALALALSAQALHPDPPTSTTDETGERLSAARLTDARALALTTLVLGLLDGGPASTTPLAAAWAATSLRRQKA